MYYPYRIRRSNESWLISYADLITNLLIFFIIIISASAIQTGKMERIIESISQNGLTEQSLTHAEKQVREELRQQQLDKDTRVELTDNGLEIVFDSGVTFDSGSAHILETVETKLDKVLMVIKSYEKRYKIAIEGHTDARPIHSDEYKSNWELSSARAMSIREKMEGLGFNPSNVRVEAYAANKPLPAQLRDHLDEEAFLAKHRRVVIRLY